MPSMLSPQHMSYSTAHREVKMGQHPEQSFPKALPVDWRSEFSPAGFPALLTPQPDLTPL